jgi:8-oxo-dGTP diphosphatase
VGDKILFLRASYRAAWNFPGGGVKRGESPEAAARRELAEETGLSAGPLIPAMTLSGVWLGRRETVHFFEWRPEALPPLRLDQREIIAARLVGEQELFQIKATGPVAAYLRKREQKNVVNLGRAGFNAAGPEEQKFLRRFFQKAAALRPRRGSGAN